MMNSRLKACLELDSTLDTPPWTLKGLFMNTRFMAVVVSRCKGLTSDFAVIHSHIVTPLI